MSTRSTMVPELPQLEAGVIELDCETVSGPLQTLVIDHLIGTDDRAYWVDSRSNASTGNLARVAPSSRLLARIDVARAFTAFQHCGLVETLTRAVDEDTSLVVVPAVDWFYTADDLGENDGKEMFTTTLDRLAHVSDAHDVPVLLTTTDTTDEHCLDDAVDERITCRDTRLGPRFTAENYETMVYPGAGYVQTTFEFWRQVLQARHELRQPTRPTEVALDGAY